METTVDFLGPKNKKYRAIFIESKISDYAPTVFKQTKHRNGISTETVSVKPSRKMIVCVLKRGNHEAPHSGVAVLSPNDTPDSEVGKTVALKRAILSLVVADVIKSRGSSFAEIKMKCDNLYHCYRLHFYKIAHPEEFEPAALDSLLDKLSNAVAQATALVAPYK